MRQFFVHLMLAGLFAAAACGDDSAVTDTGIDGGGDADAGPDDPPVPAPLDTIEQTARRVIPGLEGHAYVVRVEHEVPHIYAENRNDAWRVLGFTMAQDRFFQMDLTARLAQGHLSALLGEAGLESDIENRGTGWSRVTDIYLEAMNEEEGAEMDAFVEGINAYLEAVRTRQLPPPRELELATIFFGRRNVRELLVDWTRRDVAAAAATIVYSTSFEGGDVGRSRAFEDMASHFEGFPDRDIRLAGLQQDIIDHYAPPNDSSSALGWGLDTDGSVSMPIIGPRVPRNFHPEVVVPERTVLDRLETSLGRVMGRMSRNEDEGYGSNVWAVMGSATTDGSSILAGDGHLQLSVPALFWSFGVDTMLLGDDTEDLRMVGSTIAGLPMMGVGTNGRIAWGQTAYFADVTDWYTEELILDSDGVPTASRFRGEERPLARFEESYEVADITTLESVGRTETVARFETFDGRMITSIEGREVTADEPLGEGETPVNVMGTYIVPGDTDGDDVISAVSFYYGPFDGGSVLRGFRGFSNADTVEDFRQSMRHFVGYGGSMMASDAEGSVFYSAYHAVPCRSYLPRDGTNVWEPGADPRRLLDGTQHGAWKLPLDDNQRIDEAAAAAGAPEGCAVPFDEWPQAMNPTRQYVHHANNDPGNITHDNDIFDDPHYIGGPWIEGYRAARIEERLRDTIAAGTADMDMMADIQADHHSNLGEDYIPLLLEAIEAARTAAAGTPTPDTAEARIAARWTAASDTYLEIERRMNAWTAAGLSTPSGVETFYHSVEAGEVDDAVATTLFHAWMSKYFELVLNDERINSRLSPAVTGDTYRTQTIDLLVRGRGAGNPLGLGSWNPATEESVFFDDVTTTEVESSQEIAIRALDEALAYLAAEPTEPGRGGFGSDDMDTYLWGLRHMVRYDSLLGDFIGNDETFGPLLDEFNITPDRIPLAEGLAADDPRASLPHFPRPGDQFDIDAANPGMGLGDWTHGAGPVFRMVVALGPDGVRGRNVLPGGQSGVPSSNHFDDQARIWLENQTCPMRYLPEEVVEGATGLERFAPE